MEGVGSARLGRASARYAGSTAVFNGPVRKWKKKWVHVSSSTAKHSQSNGNGSATSSILLCRWTPLSFADSGSSAADGEDEEQPPKRKFHYTPVAVLEEKRKRAAAAKQVEKEAKIDENKTKQSSDWLSSKIDNELNMNEILKKETQASNMGNLDLGLCLKGHDSSRNSVGDKIGQEKAASSTGFWTIG